MNQTLEISVALVALSLLATLLLIFVYWKPIARVSREARRQNDTPDPDLDPATCPAASVIVYSDDNTRALEQLLADLLGQSYPSPFEVIVVLDGRSDAATAIVDRFRVDHPNVYLTFIPDEARNVSRKKLGIMLGIKAARYPVAVITTADTVIPSPLWLARMTSPFADPDTRVVIGHSLTHTADDTDFGHRARVFAEAADSTAWLSAAIGHRPYRGIENNIAYTRQAFFENRGFARSLNLVNGDDDIFISEIARPGNTAVVLHPDANVTRSVTDHRRYRRETRNRYAFTGRHVARAMRRRLAFGAWLLWLQALTAIAAAILAWTQLPPPATLTDTPLAELPILPFALLAVAVILWLATIITTTSVWRRTIIALGGCPLRMTVYPLALGRPLANTLTTILSHRHSDSHLTWTK